MDTIVWHRRSGRSRPRPATRVAKAIVAIAWLVLVSSGGLCHAAPEPEQNLERSVKAAFLYNFLNFASWPTTSFGDAISPFVIGVLGSDTMAGEVSRLVAGHQVSGRAVEVRTVKRGESLAGLHVLFVGRAETSQLASLAQAAQQQSVLLVSESERGLGLGSSINLVVVDGRIRFDVSLDAAEKSGVRLSSRLLAVARSVRAGAE